jgi:hypothetical protein
LIYYRTIEIRPHDNHGVNYFFIFKKLSKPSGPFYEGRRCFASAGDGIGAQKPNGKIYFEKTIFPCEMSMVRLSSIF